LMVEVMRQFFRVRFALLRMNPAPVLDALRGGAPIGLFLRGFSDEDTVVPVSRDELARLLQSMTGVTFISISNPIHARSTPGVLVLEVPSTEWKNAVSDLMQVAAVIVIDTNAGMFHWLEGIDRVELQHFGEVTAELNSRKGLVEEIERITEKGFSRKSVVVVPPGWSDMLRSGEVESEIAMEERALAYCKSRYSWVKHDAEFPRTRIKRLLKTLPITVSGDEEVRLGVEEILAEGACPVRESSPGPISP
jgi:hypothetical protein